MIVMHLTALTQSACFLYQDRNTVHWYPGGGRCRRETMVQKGNRGAEGKPCMLAPQMHK